MSAHAEVWTEVEEAIGKLTLDETLAEEGRLTDPLLQSWVDRVGGDVCRHSSRKHIRYRFYVSAACVSNAYSLPGGYVVVTSGLLNHVSSDEELAGVIAHEIAHLGARDDRPRLAARTLAWTSVVIVVVFAGSAIATGSAFT
ncbi:MAG: M48 family metalloprotease, partial [Armatimonadota bacterium]